jgi:hypothetical protein
MGKSPLWQAAGTAPSQIAEAGDKKRAGEYPARKRLRADEPASEFVQLDLAKLLLEDLASLEFHHSALGNDHFSLGLVGIAPDARLAPLDFQDAEVAKFHIPSISQGFLNDIQGELDGFYNLLLGEVGLLVDFKDDLAFGKVR